MNQQLKEGGFENKKILVTGGLGFIGSNLVIRLASYGAHVLVLDSLIPEFGGSHFNLEPVASQVNVNIVDMRDAHALRILARDQDYIFHLAGQVSHGDSMRDPEKDLAINCVATLNLVEACRHYNPNARLVYTSTRQVYGIPRQLPVTEDHPVLPVDVNGINKLAGEYYHLLYQRTYGLKSVVLRLTNTYGPRQQLRNDRQGFISVFLRRALMGKSIQIFGDGQQIRDFNYVDDVVEALLSAAQSDVCFGHVYNLGAPKRYTLLDFISLLKQNLDFDYELIPFPTSNKLIDIGDYYGDYGRFQKASGWEPRIDLEEGIRRTVSFYQANKENYLNESN